MLITYDPSVPGRLKVSKVYNVTYDDAITYAAKKSVELKEGDAIFCLPDTSIPRFKLQGIYEKYGFNSVKNIKAADYIFIGQKSTSNSLKALSTKQVTYTRCYLIPDIKTVNAFKHAFDPASPAYAPEAVRDMIANHLSEFVISEDDANSYRLYIHQETGKYPWFRYSYIRENFISLPEPSLYSKLRSEEHLLQVVSSESIVITDQKFEELQRMFDSGIDYNIVLAMEIMANSNYNESIINNYFLILDNAHRIRRLKEATHKNFKALLTFFNLDLSSIGGRFTVNKLEQLTTLLKDYGMFTESSMQRMLEKFSSDNAVFRGVYYNAEIRPNEGLTYDD